jgi:hypothetical protein
VFSDIVQNGLDVIVGIPLAKRRNITLVNLKIGRVLSKLTIDDLPLHSAGSRR